MDDEERSVLRSLIEQLIELVAPEDSVDSTDPLAELIGPMDLDATLSDDPVLARLLPDAYPDDPEAAQDFRRFTERSLRELKVANAATVQSCLERSGGKITLTSDEANAWLGALNDLRLTVGVRLGITEDYEEVTDPADPRFTMYQVYGWLTYLQDTLLNTLMSAP